MRERRDNSEKSSFQDPVSRTENTGQLETDAPHYGMAQRRLPAPAGAYDIRVRVHTDGSIRLNVLAREIIQAHEDIEAAKATGVKRAREAGIKLIEAKRVCGHGRWLPWLETIGVPHATASVYMRIARLPPAKLLTVSNLGLLAALDIAHRQARPDGAAQRGQPRRDGPDFWPTPRSLITALVDHVVPDLPPGPIWECAAGNGRVATAIRATGRLVIATDLFPQNGEPEHDFLADDLPAEAAGSIAVTNPPFNKSEEFLEHGLALLDSGKLNGVVFLLRDDHLMSQTRAKLFNRAVREFRCNWRPIWIPESKGNPRWSFHWLTWHSGDSKPPLYLDQKILIGAEQVGPARRQR